MKIAIAGFPGYGKSPCFKAIMKKKSEEIKNLDPTNSMYKIKKLYFSIFLSIILLTGCGQVSENTVNAVLEKDPSFGRILSSKKKIDSKISSFKGELSKESDLTAQKIEKLKSSLQNIRNQYRSQITALKQKMDPEIQELKAKLEENRAEYKKAAEKLGDYNGKLKNIKRLLDKKSELSLSGDEISIWNKRIKKIEKDIVTSQKKLDNLRNKIYITKIEIRILKH